MVIPNPQTGIAATSAEGGAYVESLRRETDLARFTAQEWATLIR